MLSVGDVRDAQPAGVPRKPGWRVSRTSDQTTEQQSVLLEKGKILTASRRCQRLRGRQRRSWRRQSARVPKVSGSGIGHYTRQLTSALILVLPTRVLLGSVQIDDAAQSLDPQHQSRFATALKSATFSTCTTRRILSSPVTRSGDSPSVTGMRARLVEDDRINEELLVSFNLPAASAVDPDRRSSRGKILRLSSVLGDGGFLTGWKGGRTCSTGGTVR